MQQAKRAYKENRFEESMTLAKSVEPATIESYVCVAKSAFQLEKYAIAKEAYLAATELDTNLALPWKVHVLVKHSHNELFRVSEMLEISLTMSNCGYSPWSIWRTYCDGMRRLINFRAPCRTCANLEWSRKTSR